MEDWKKQAIHYFYKEEKTLTEIALALDKNKATISKHLKTNDSQLYALEKERRKKISAIKEVERKRNWKRENDAQRKKDMDQEFEKELLRRQHEQDVMGMSTRSIGNVIGMWESGYIRSAYQQKGSSLVRKNRTSSGAAVPAAGLPKKI